MHGDADKILLGHHLVFLGLFYRTYEKRFQLFIQPDVQNLVFLDQWRFRYQLSDCGASEANVELVPSLFHRRMI